MEKSTEVGAAKVGSALGEPIVLVEGRRDHDTKGASSHTQKAFADIDSTERDLGRPHAVLHTIPSPRPGLPSTPFGSPSAPHRRSYGDSWTIRRSSSSLSGDTSPTARSSFCTIDTSAFPNPPLSPSGHSPSTSMGPFPSPEVVSHSPTWRQHRSRVSLDATLSGSPSGPPIPVSPPRRKEFENEMGRTCINQDDDDYIDLESQPEVMPRSVTATSRRPPAMSPMTRCGELLLESSDTKLHVSLPREDTATSRPAVQEKNTPETARIEAKAIEIDQVGNGLRSKAKRMSWVTRGRPHSINDKQSVAETSLPGKSSWNLSAPSFNRESFVSNDEMDTKSRQSKLSNLHLKRRTSLRRASNPVSASATKLTHRTSQSDITIRGAYISSASNEARLPSLASPSSPSPAHNQRSASARGYYARQDDTSTYALSENDLPSTLKLGGLPPPWRPQSTIFGRRPLSPPIVEVDEENAHSVYPRIASTSLTSMVTPSPTNLLQLLECPPTRESNHFASTFVPLREGPDTGAYDVGGEQAAVANEQIDSHQTGQGSKGKRRSLVSRVKALFSSEHSRGDTSPRKTPVSRDGFLKGSFPARFAHSRANLVSSLSLVAPQTDTDAGGDDPRPPRSQSPWEALQTSQIGKRLSKRHWNGEDSVNVSRSQTPAFDTGSKSPTHRRASFRTFRYSGERRMKTPSLSREEVSLVRYSTADLDLEVNIEGEELGLDDILDKDKRQSIVHQLLSQSSTNLTEMSLQDMARVTSMPAYMDKSSGPYTIPHSSTIATSRTCPSLILGRPIEFESAALISRGQLSPSASSSCSPASSRALVTPMLHDSRDLDGSAKGLKREGRPFTHRRRQA